MFAPIGLIFLELLTVVACDGMGDYVMLHLIRDYGCVWSSRKKKKKGGGKILLCGVVQVCTKRTHKMVERDGCGALGLMMKS